MRRLNNSKKANGGSSVCVVTFPERMRFKPILSSLKKLRGDMLDVGCGYGALGRMLEINGRYVTYLDVRKLPLLKGLRKRERVVADGSALPLGIKALTLQPRSIHWSIYPSLREEHLSQN